MTARGRLRWWLRPAALVLIATLWLGSAPAAAVVAPSVVREGGCNQQSVWRLTVRLLDADTLRVRLGIAGGPAGDTWNVFLDHNGVGFFSGSRVSRIGGIVIVRATTPNLAGLDRIRAGAHDIATDETCSGRATHL